MSDLQRERGADPKKAQAPAVVQSPVSETEFPDPAALLANQSNLDGQAVALQQLPRVQAQAMARQVGQLQGNRHVQRMIHRVQDSRRVAHDSEAQAGPAAQAEEFVAAESESSWGAAAQPLLTPAAGGNGEEKPAGGPPARDGMDRTEPKPAEAKIAPGGPAGTGGAAPQESTLPVQTGVESGADVEKTAGAIDQARAAIQAEPAPFDQPEGQKIAAPSGAEVKKDGQVSAKAEADVQSLQQQSGEPLPEGTRTEMESQLGADFSQVRIHRDEKAAETAQQVGARAFTVGNHIAFNAGEYAPESGAGKKLLAHELTHVVQQSGEQGARPVVARESTPTGNQGNFLEQLQQKIAEIISRAQGIADQRGREVESSAGTQGASVEGRGRTESQNVSGEATAKAATGDAEAASESQATETQAGNDSTAAQNRSETEGQAVENQATAESQSGQSRAQTEAQGLESQAAGKKTELGVQATAGIADLQNQSDGLQTQTQEALSGIEAQSGASWNGVEQQGQAAGMALENSWGATSNAVTSQAPTVEGNTVTALRGIRDEAIEAVETANPKSGKDLAPLEGTRDELFGRAQNLLNGGQTPFSFLLDQLQSGWNGLKGIAGALWEQAKGAAGSSLDFVKNLGRTAWNGLQNGWQRLQSLSQGLWQGLSGRASSAWNALQQLAGSAAQGFQSMAGTALANLKSRAMAAWTGLQTLTNTAVTNLKNRAATALTGLKGRATAAWNGLQRLAASVWSALQGQGNSAQTGVQGEGNSAVSSVTSVASGFLDKIGGILSGLRNRVGNAVGQLRGRVQSALSGLQQRSSQALSTLQSRFQAAQQMFQQRSQTAVSGLTSVAGQALQWLQGRGNAAATGLGDRLSSFLEWLKSIGSAAVSGLQGFWQQIQGQVGNAWSGFQRLVGSLWSRLQSGIDSLWQRLMGLWEALKARLLEVWRRIQEAFAALKDRLFQNWERIRKSWAGILARSLALWGRARGADKTAWPGVTREAQVLKADALQLKARAGGPGELQDPTAVRQQLGEGRPLEGSVRSGMEAAFGASFAKVQIHTDRRAVQLARQANARAFTVGEHIAFDSQEYRPGTPEGDALLAHEMAHTLQQRGSPAGSAAKGNAVEESAEEMDADRAAVGAVANRWAGVKNGAGAIPEQFLPRLRSGLGLRRCSRTSNPPQIDFGRIPNLNLGQTFDPNATVSEWNDQEHAGEDIQLSVAGQSDQNGRADVAPESVTGNGPKSVSVTGKAPTQSGLQAALSVVGSFDGENVGESNRFSVVAPRITFGSIDQPFAGQTLHFVSCEEEFPLQVTIDNYQADWGELPIQLRVEGTGDGTGTVAVNGAAGEAPLTGQTGGAGTARLQGITPTTAKQGDGLHPLEALKVSAYLENVKVGESRTFYIRQRRDHANAAVAASALTVTADERVKRAYEGFRDRTYGFFFSRNSALAGSAAKPAPPAGPTYQDYLNWSGIVPMQALMALGTLSGVPTNAIGPGNYQDFLNGLNQWPDGMYAIFQSGEDTATCNLVTGDILYNSGITVMRSEGKYYGADQIYRGEADGNHLTLLEDGTTCAGGDLVNFGSPHIEVVTEAYSDGNFCSLSDFDPIGVVKQRILDLELHRFRRVS